MSRISVKQATSVTCTSMLFTAVIQQPRKIPIVDSMTYESYDLSSLLLIYGKKLFGSKALVPILEWYISLGTYTYMVPQALALI